MMLTGRPPFNGDTAPEILASVLVRDPDFSTLPPNLNPRVVDLLRRCLDKNPKRRWHASSDLRSPDGQFIAFFADGKLKKIDAGGGPALTLADARVGRGGSWSRNGVILFAPVNVPGLQRVSSAGGVSSPVPSEGGSFPWFLPDGEHFLYQEQGTDFPIRIGSLDGRESTVVGAGSNPIYANGHLLFLREGTLMAQPFEADRLATVGAMSLFKMLVAEMNLATPNAKPQYAVSADGPFLITVPVEDATSASMTLVQSWISRTQ
jgi:hypothetical protein